MVVARSAVVFDMHSGGCAPRNPSMEAATLRVADEEKRSKKRNTNDSKRKTKSITVRLRLLFQ